MKASTDKFGKQIETYQEEKLKWNKRFNEAHAELTKLKKQITDKVSALLVIRSLIHPSNNRSLSVSAEY